jgi:hypothetical protein
VSYKIGRDGANANTSFEVTVGGTQYFATNTGGSEWSQGDWFHVTLTYDGETLLGYINGEQVALNTSPSGSIDYAGGNTDKVVGMHSTYSSGEFFTGNMDDVRIYNHALSTDDIKRLYKLGATTKIASALHTQGVLEDGLRAHFTFDGKTVSASTVSDRSGQGNHGGIEGAAASGGQAAFVRSATNDTANSTTISVANFNVADTGAGNRALILDSICADSAALSLSSLSFDPTGLNVAPTQLSSVQMISQEDGTDSFNYRHYVLEEDLPQSGNYTITATYNGSCNEIALGALLYENVDQTTPFGTPVTDQETDDGTNATYTSPSVTGADGDIVLDQYLVFEPTSSPHGSQTIRASNENLGGFDSYYATEKTLSGQTSTTFFYTNDDTGFSEDITWMGVAIKGAAASGGSLSTVPGRIGQAVSFDGSDDRIVVSPDASLDNLTSFTYAAWIYVADHTKTTNAIMSKGDGDEGTQQKRFGVHSGSACDSGSTDGCILAAIVTSGSERRAVSVADTILSNRWYHVAATYTSGSAPRIYVNGTEVSYAESENGTGTDVDESAGSLLFGTLNGDDQPSNHWFQGKMDDVRVYDRVLSLDELQRLYKLGATTKINTTITPTAALNQGIEVHWTFDGQHIDTGLVTGHVKDSSPHGRIATISGDKVFIPGKVAQAIRFESSDSVSAVSNAAYSPANNDLTISFWTRPDVLASADWQVVASKGEWHIRLLNGGAINFLIDNNSGGTHCLATGPALAANTWVYLTAVWTGSDCLLYYNAALQDSGNSLSGTVEVSGSTALILGHLAQSRFYTGSYDDFRMYSRALSLDEIMELYTMSH